MLLEKLPEKLEDLDKFLIPWDFPGMDIARSMTHLLEKETPFVFSKDCIDALETLKKKLTGALILVVPDWNLPFELMCDASDFTIGAVLGQQFRLKFHIRVFLFMIHVKGARPMGNHRNASWDLWHNHMGCWDKVNGIVPVGWSTQERSVGVKGILVGKVVLLVKAGGVGLGKGQ
nr:reverse transcriptase domain-containing protein [Tanacetum cinerariifolium]